MRKSLLIDEVTLYQRGDDYEYKSGFNHDATGLYLEKIKMFNYTLLELYLQRVLLCSIENCE